MIIKSVKFKGHGYFKEEWAGFDEIKLINILIGRNNVGKSHLLDLVESLCSSQFPNHNWSYKCSGLLDEISLKRYFNERNSGGELGGNYWLGHGRHMIDNNVEWILSPNKIMGEVNIDFSDDPTSK